AGERVRLDLSVRLQAVNGDNLRAAGILRGVGGVPGVPGEERGGNPAAGNGVHHFAGADVCRRAADLVAAAATVRIANRKHHDVYQDGLRDVRKPGDHDRDSAGSHRVVLAGAAGD